MASTAQTNNSSGSAFSLGNFALPMGLTVGLFVLSFTPRVQSSLALIWSFWAAVLALLLWQAYLLLLSKRRGVEHGFSIVVHSQHYIQAMVQFSVYLYWGYFWRPVYDHMLLLLAQVLFAFAFGTLLAWSRGRNYTLGFGPIPIIFSTNLFLWFRDDWFYMQFLMIAVGFMGKEYVRWNREGRSVHIFNPSAFALGLFSLVLIVTDSTNLTWAPLISSNLTLAPNIYLFLFFAGLVVMHFFSITLVAGSAALVLFGSSALYSIFNGVPYFLDSEIPAAVFLGLHLLVTDPSTSPRTPLGKMIFGGLYGIGVFALYTILDLFGAPTFYDKLLCVPLLNLSVIAIDRAVRSINSEAWLNVWNPNWFGGRANLAHMSVWIAVFAFMSMLDKTDGQHAGDSLPFWEESCAESLNGACDRLLLIEGTYCNDNAAWACNELGIHYRQGEITEINTELAFNYFSQACELKFKSGCLNLLNEDRLIADLPKELDLRLMLRQGGKNLIDLPASDLYTKACDHNWSFACDELNIESQL
jgi:hypothetical protein|tara:strand:+ start:442 stop:2025 length:1584 start_codon:yes stop_codon:yes gene_type:complete